MMKEISESKYHWEKGDKTAGVCLKAEKISRRKIGFDPSIITLISEIGINFFHYLKILGMSGETNLVILSSKHQYSYDKDDLKKARILINLKKLNLIKHLDIFLNSLVRILPPNTNFIGYFSDKKEDRWHGFQLKGIMGLLNRFNNLFDFSTAHIMNRDEVTELLERNGFKTIDMKEMNGRTYFISQTIGLPV